MLVTQSLLIFLVSMIGYSNATLGSSLIGRPLVFSALVGLALGDLSTGIQVGATLELVWLGAQAIGASNPPDMVSGTVIGCGYVITTGSEISTAVALAVPVSLLVSMVWNAEMAIVGPMMSARADKYAEECNRRGIDLMHWGFVIFQTVSLGALCGIGFYVGTAAIEAMVNAIPAFVTTGLDYAMGILPAIGFAMLTRMIVDKKTACFLFLGFLLVAYGGMNIVGVAAAGIIMALILVLNTNAGSKAAPAADALPEGVDDDDNEF